jgi:hypothetical protein
MAMCPEHRRSRAFLAQARSVSASVDAPSRVAADGADGTGPAIETTRSTSSRLVEEWPIAAMSWY